MKTKEQMVAHFRWMSDQAWEKFESLPDDDVETAMYYFGQHDAFATTAIELDMFLAEEAK